MSDNAKAVKAIIDGDTSDYIVVTNHEGEENFIKIDSANCGARSADRKLRCTLDVHHRLLGSSHLHRHEDGRLEAFRIK